nr:hypothetical protein [Methanoculleus sp.]
MTADENTRIASGPNAPAMTASTPRSTRSRAGREVVPGTQFFGFTTISTARVSWSSTSTRVNEGDAPNSGETVSSSPPPPIPATATFMRGSPAHLNR